MPWRRTLKRGSRGQGRIVPVRPRSRSSVRQFGARRRRRHAARVDRDSVFRRGRGARRVVRAPGRGARVPSGHRFRSRMRERRQPRRDARAAARDAAAAPGAGRGGSQPQFRQGGGAVRGARGGHRGRGDPHGRGPAGSAGADRRDGAAVGRGRRGGRRAPHRPLERLDDEAMERARLLQDPQRHVRRGDPRGRGRLPASWTARRWTSSTRCPRTAAS